ncbi:hypothetical protein SDC9_155147 [bioreactor metagenome]|uniref:DUF4321 domain-containing protein n=1 Tax=bioreactor metagenome TaxID=1076179 RepID=A0A645F0P5_9ZZZZ|nr:DUF4321 domain-containing protein [Lachnospiraceae bacterium]
MRRSDRSIWSFVLIMLAGVVVGGFIGELLGGFSFLSWLRYGQTFGLTSPLTLDMGILCFQFALSIKFSIAGIIGIIIAVLIYKNI